MVKYGVGGVEIGISDQIGSFIVIVSSAKVWNWVCEIIISYDRPAIMKTMKGQGQFAGFFRMKIF